MGETVAGSFHRTPVPHKPIHLSDSGSGEMEARCLEYYGSRKPKDFSQGWFATESRVGKQSVISGWCEI